MKHFLQKLVSQLMDCKVDVQSKEKESVQVIQKNVHYSMDSLSAWYMSVTQVNVNWQFFFFFAKKLAYDWRGLELQWT